MKAVFILILSIITCSAQAGLQRMTLSQAMKAKVIDIKATGNGGYHEKSIKLHITNKSGNPLIITIDQGVVFRPSDTTDQDLVLAGAEVISVAPFKDGIIDVQTFCVIAHNGPPSKDEVFTFHRIHNDTMIRALQYLKQNHLFDGLGQSAVWAISDDHNLQGIYGTSPVAQKLLDFMVSITGYPRPTVFYINDISDVPNAPVRSTKALKIIALFEQILTEPAKLTLGVYNASGTLIQKVFEEQQFPKKGHRFKVEFEAQGVQAGKYFIRLKKGDVVLQEKEVTVE